MTTFGKWRKPATLAMVMTCVFLGQRTRAIDYIQGVDLGNVVAADVVSATVTPPGVVLTGAVTNAGVFTWAGGPASFNATIPLTYLGTHNGQFNGTYRPTASPGGAGGGGPEHTYTWQMSTTASVIEFVLVAAPASVCVCEGVTVQITANASCTLAIVRDADGVAVATAPLAANTAYNWVVAKTVMHGNYTATGTHNGRTATAAIFLKNDNSKGAPVNTGDVTGCDPGDDEDIWSGKDSCDNDIEIRCEDEFVMRYNGTEIARCKWHNGQNVHDLFKTKDGCKYHSGYWYNRDPDNSGSGDEGVLGMYDFWYYTYDFVATPPQFTAVHYAAPNYPAVLSDPGVYIVP